jgi:hypothetical protein
LEYKSKDIVLEVPEATGTVEAKIRSTLDEIEPLMSKLYLFVPHNV